MQNKGDHFSLGLMLNKLACLLNLLAPHFHNFGGVLSKIVPGVYHNQSYRWWGAVDLAL